MEPSKPAAETFRFDKTLYPTSNTKLAAALLTLGVPFFDPAVPPVSNVYSEDRPYKSANVPGRVTYHLAGNSAGGAKAEVLAEAWEKGKQDIELDTLVDTIEQANPELGKQLRDLLPLALMVYARGFYENRERILDLWKRAQPMIHVKKGENSFSLISRNASPEFRARALRGS